VKQRLLSQNPGQFVFKKMIDKNSPPEDAPGVGIYGQSSSSTEAFSCPTEKRIETLKTGFCPYIILH